MGVRHKHGHADGGALRHLYLQHNRAQRSRSVRGGDLPDRARSSGTERAVVERGQDHVVPPSEVGGKTAALLAAGAESAGDLPRSNALLSGRGERSTLASILGAHPIATAASAVAIGAMGASALVSMGTLHADYPGLEQRGAHDRGIVFVGMNETGRHEVDGILRGMPDGHVTHVRPSPRPDVVKLGGVTYDLTTDPGRAGFVAKLALQGDRADALAKILQSAEDNARDEIAQLAIVLAQADRGERFIERIVFSGHSTGYSVWGDGNGSLKIQDVAKLATVFPRAAGQVQDLILGACYTGGETNMDTYRAIFPNVKTIWAYDGAAPGAYSGAVPHFVRWENSTRGASTDRVSRDLARGTRKGENIAVWTVTRGYDNGQPQRDLTEVRAAYERTRGVLPTFHSGERPVEDLSQGPLRDHYNSIHRLLSRRDISPDERAALNAEKQIVIRLLYWKNISSMFQVTHRATISQGFTELGMQVPDFSRMSRKDAMRAIADFDARVADRGAASRTVRYLTEILHDGLRDLKPTHIPEAWM